MKRLKNLLLLLTFSAMLPGSLSAQSIEMAEGMRSEGKIYVVIVIAFFVLAVMSIYLINIDRRVRRMENRQK